MSLLDDGVLRMPRNASLAFVGTPAQVVALGPTLVGRAVRCVRPDGSVIYDGIVFHDSSNGYYIRPFYGNVLLGRKGCSIFEADAGSGIYAGKYAAADSVTVAKKLNIGEDSLGVLVPAHSIPIGGEVGIGVSIYQRGNGANVPQSYKFRLGGSGTSADEVVSVSGSSQLVANGVSFVYKYAPLRVCARCVSNSNFSISPTQIFNATTSGSGSPVTLAGIDRATDLYLTLWGTLDSAGVPNNITFDVSVFLLA